MALLSAMGKKAEAEAALRSEAWIGDAVLELFARNWLLHRDDLGGRHRDAWLAELVSNRALAGIGEPTRVEAEIGRLYRDRGIEAAFERIRERMVPVWEKRLQAPVRGGRRTGS